MSLLYLSDLHLQSEEDEQGKRFLRFLQSLTANQSLTLVLGGDIFDLFVGSSYVFREKFKNTLGELFRLSHAGVKIYYLEGNHDFHMARLFSERGNIQLKQDDFSLEEEGKQLFFSHGDLIDPEDRGYRFLRLVTRSLPFRVFLFLLPGLIVKMIGEWSSRKSRNYNNLDRLNQEQKQRTKALFLDFAKSKVAAGYDAVFIGHSHLPDFEEFEAGARRGSYVNLGYSAREILYCSYAQSFLELRKFS